MKKYKVSLLLSNGDSSAFTAEAESSDEIFDNVFQNNFLHYEAGRHVNRVRVSDISRVSVVELKESSGPFPE